MTENKLPKNFGFGEDEALLKDLAGRFLRDEFPVERLRDLVAADPDSVYQHGALPAWDRELWKRCVEMGWGGLAVGVDEGGAGFSRAGIVGVVEEVGRAAFPSPLVATLNASFVLRESEGPSARAWLRRIAEGATASLACTNARGDWRPHETDLQVDQEGRLTGTAYFVQDAFKADFFVVLARGGEGSSSRARLYGVPADAAGVSLEQDHIHDLTRDQAKVTFKQVGGSGIDLISDLGSEALARAWPTILVLASADLCGTAEWQLQTTTEYAKTRKQFDRPIGFFQAVKHPLSNAMIGIDRARALVYHAASCLDQGHRDAEKAARMAKSAASDAGRFVSDRSVQLHGGIGFTWECDVHVYFKRSMHNQALYGDGAYQRRWLADRIIGPVGAA